MVRADQPDILFSNMDHANLVAILGTKGLPRRPRVVLSIQNPLSFTYRHECHVTHRLTLWSISYLYPHADFVVALSEGVAREVVGLVPKIRNRIRVIHNAGVDETVLIGAQEPLIGAGFLRDEYSIVACGRLTEEKGFDYLIHAFADVRRSTPAHLWIVGDGPLRQKLEKEIQKLGIGDYVHLLGFQKNPFKFMASADVFVLSSLWEGFGNVIVEAMACGVPVIATNCPYGPGEIIDDGINGLLVPPADASALADCIIRVLRDRELRRKLSVMGRLRAGDFEANKITSEYEKLFFGTLDGFKPEDKI
jgi:glycosyltransferase involved in cell wall biosynthesis